MTIHHQWLIDVPHVENLHTAVHGFLRTSEYGSWEPDPSVVSDSFVLSYRRGRELPPPPGRFQLLLSRWHNYEDFLTASNWPGDQPPVRLRVTLRPNRNGIRIGIEWELCTQYAELYRTMAGLQLEERIEAEFKSLAKYLAEYCNLGTIPQLISE